MDGSWVAPDACTLPTAERPLRVAEFDALFAGHLRCLEWHGRAAMSMDLSGDVGLTEAVRDLVERESACCSFFSFTVTTGAGPAPASTSTWTSRCHPVGRTCWSLSVPARRPSVRRDDVGGRAVRRSPAHR